MDTMFSRVLLCGLLLVSKSSGQGTMETTPASLVDRSPMEQYGKRGGDGESERERQRERERETEREMEREGGGSRIQIHDCHIERLSSKGEGVGLRQLCCGTERERERERERARESASE
jgi:hypothetical protein